MIGQYLTALAGLALLALAWAGVLHFANRDGEAPAPGCAGLCDGLASNCPARRRVASEEDHDAPC
jgi:hypothetical protein